MQEQTTKQQPETLDQHFGANFIKVFFCQILQQISYFFAFVKLFSTKTNKNKDFGQRLECTAPKCWLKCTTVFSSKVFVIGR